MDYVIVVIAAILALVLLALAIKLLKGALKIIGIALLIALLITGAVSYFLVKDAAALAKGIRENRSLFLLKEGGTIVSGFTIQATNISTLRFLGDEELAKMSGLYLKKDYGGMLGENYKIVLFDRQSLPKVEEIDIDKLIEIPISEKEELPNGLRLPAGFGGNLLQAGQAAFPMLVLYGMKKDPAYLIKEYRKGNIFVYPETIIFRAAKAIPWWEK